MIPIHRGEEPPGLPAIRAAELARLRALFAVRPPTKEDFGSRYNEVREVLWRRQHYKCCYCEAREQFKRNDTEHFRPKARALRGEDFPKDGYWWLAWTWENLLFACRNCNQDAKRDQFPLEPGSPLLAEEHMPPGSERTLLIDPCVDNPIDHIQFRRLQRTGRAQRWVPTARNGSIQGAQTIRILKLARADLLELYSLHVEQHVQGELIHLFEAEPGGLEGVRRAWDALTLRLLTPSLPFVGLSYDALHELVPESFRTRWGLRVPRPRSC